jgi:hypothetical protein
MSITWMDTRERHRDMLYYVGKGGQAREHAILGVDPRLIVETAVLVVDLDSH